MTNDFQCTIPKEKIYDADYLKFVLQVAASSASFGTICLTEPSQLNGVYHSRGNLNALLIAPFGSGKTSQVFNIIGTPVIYGNDHTKAGMIGSISKTGDHTVGAAFRAGGKLAIWDETQDMHYTVKDCLNSLMEGKHEYKREIGFKTTKPVKMGSLKSGGIFKINGNSIYLYSKFSCIASSMFIKLGTRTENAWYSRFVPIRINIDSFDYYRRLSKGEIVYEILADYHKEKINFTFPRYIEFADWFWDRIEDSHWKSLERTRQDDLAFVNRSLQDIVRMAAFKSITNGGNEIQPDDAKGVVNQYHDQMLYNLYTGALTENEYRVISLIGRKISQEQMSIELGISQPTVSKILYKLKAFHLITGDIPVIALKEGNADGEMWEQVYVPKELEESLPSG